MLASKSSKAAPSTAKKIDAIAKIPSAIPKQADTQAQVASAIASGSPAVMQSVATAIAVSNPAAAQELRQLQPEITKATTPAISPAPAVLKTTITETLKPLVALLWKKPNDAIVTKQIQEAIGGLVIDGKFGPKTKAAIEAILGQGSAPAAYYKPKAVATQTGIKAVMT